MNNKGQTIGFLVLAAIALIVALALLPQIFSSQEQLSHNYVYNGSVQATGSVTPAAAGSAVWVTGQSLLSTPLVINKTGTEACAANFTFAAGINPSTNLKGIKMTSDALYDAAVACRLVNISYTYGADGYADDAGSRAIGGQIGLFAAVALLAISIFYWAKSNGWLSGFI